MAAWDAVRRTLVQLGHRVSLVPPRSGLPGMVFAGHAATVVGGRVLGARFRAAERREEGPAYLRWFADRGYDACLEPIFAHEGAADLLPVGRLLLAASGPHTEERAHDEAGAFLALPVVPLELVDPRFPGLGSAIAVLGGRMAAYYPGAFSPASRRTLGRLFPDILEVDEAEALGSGLDLVGDGGTVVLPDTAPRLARRLATRGFRTIAVDMTPFAAAGAGVRSCVLELRDNR
jgi:N-dimethylarginine dimethylaminohydrolase